MIIAIVMAINYLVDSSVILSVISIGAHANVALRGHIKVCRGKVISYYTVGHITKGSLKSAKQEWYG